MSEQGFVIHVKEMADFPDAVYVGRQNNRYGLEQSPYANPYPIGRKWGNRANVVRLYREWAKVALDRRAIYLELKDKPLACWRRRHDQPKTEDNVCHADVLLELIADYGRSNDPS